MAIRGLLIEGRELKSSPVVSAFQWGKSNDPPHTLEGNMSGPTCLLDRQLMFFADLWRIVYSSDMLKPVGADGQPGVEIRPTETNGLMSVVFTNLGTRIILAPANISLKNLRKQFVIEVEYYDGIAISPIIS